MIQLFLGCLSWIFLVFSVKSQMRHYTGLDEWEYYMLDGIGCVSVTHLREDASLKEEKDSDPEETGEDSESEKEEEVEETSSEEEAIDSYVMAEPEEENKNEDASEKKESEEDVDEKNSSDESVEEMHKEEDDGSEERHTVWNTWRSTPHAGMDHFMEEILQDLTFEEKGHVNFVISKAQKIMELDWAMKAVVIAQCDTFEIRDCSERVRARLMGPAIWQGYSDGSREMCEYLFSKSIMRWIEEED